MLEVITDRYGLIWPGKAAARAQVQEPARGALHPRPDRSVGFSAARHVVIEGENLATLRLLRPAYHRAVKLIYIDPPYNTGKQFIYPDDFRHDVGTWSELMGGASDAGGRHHSRWLTMMYPRLALARDLLRDDGLIAVSIDDREVHNLRLLLDELFGPENFVAQLIWKKKAGGGGDVDLIVTDHEYIVVYRRGPGATVFVDEEAQVSTSYLHIAGDGRRYSLERLDKQSLGYTESLDFPITAPDGTVYTVAHSDPAHKRARWRWSRQTVSERSSELVFRQGCVYTRNYEKRGARPRSLLVDERFGRTRSGKADLRALFGADVHDFPKPVRLLTWLTRVLCGPEDLVLDFFAGAGTTGEGVLEANARDGGTRRFVLVQLPHPTGPRSTARKVGLTSIAETCRERVSRALTARGSSDGLRSFVLGPAAAPPWSPTPAELRAALSAPPPRPEADPLALAHELALAAGLPLHLPWTPQPALGSRSFRVGDLLICLEPTLSEPIVEAAAACGAARVILLDSAVAGRDDLLLRLRRDLERAGGAACWTV